MFTVFEGSKEVETFSKFSQALSKIRSSNRKIVDEKGFQYFSDGTGLGFRAMKESNADLFYAKHGIYNQSKPKLTHIINNARVIKCKHGLEESLAYLSRVRSKIKN